jgi:hypothetical protein
MAKLVLTNAVVKINSVDYSTNINQVEIAVSSDEVDTTAFSSTGWRTVTGGLKSANVTLSFHNDYAASGIDSVLWAALNTVATVVVIPNGTAVSASNPSYSFTALVNSVTPISGSIGDLVVQNLSWPVSGEIVRGTTA